MDFPKIRYKDAQYLNLGHVLKLILFFLRLPISDFFLAPFLSFFLALLCSLALAFCILSGCHKMAKPRNGTLINYRYSTAQR